MSLALGVALLLAAQPQAAPVQPAPLIIDQNRPDRAPAPAIAPPRPTLAPAAEITAGAAGVAIRGIAFTGTKVPPRVAAAAETFLGRPAARETLEALAAAMSDAYAASDVALYSIAIPDQSFAGGAVRIAVMEGYIEQVRFTGGETPLLRAYATALAAERPLTRHRLERYLSLMRDVPGATVDIQLLRGSRPGAVVLQIGAKRRRPQIALGFDNQGNSLVGQAQLRAEVHGYSLARDGDRTDLTGIVSPDFNRLRYVALSHATPIGSDGATLSGSIGLLSTRPKGGAISGEAHTFGLTAAYPLIRGYKRNLTLTAGIDGIDNDAALLGALFSSDHTRAARLAAGYAQNGKRTAFGAGLTLSRGLGIFAARGTPGFTDTVFTKVNGRVNYDRQIAKMWFVHLRAAGQWSTDRLAAAERFAVGGADFGRAFDQALVSGDKGIAGSGELALRPALPGKLKGSEIYGFVDGAAIGTTARPPYRAGDFDLASAGGGVRLVRGDRASITLEAARTIDKPYPGYRDKWRVNLAWRLALARG